MANKEVGVVHRNDRLLARLMSKDTSSGNSSCRVYYGGLSGAIPFLWESTPGTPKHTLADSSSVPFPFPLTPPPSYYPSPLPECGNGTGAKSGYFRELIFRAPRKLLCHSSPRSIPVPRSRKTRQHRRSKLSHISEGCSTPNGRVKNALLSAVGWRAG